MRESNSRDWIHNPAPKPFGQSRHRIWSWSSESNTRRRGTSSLHFHCARPAKLWSWHAASNRGLALTVRLLFPLSYTSGAGAAIRSPQQANTRLAGDPDSNADHRLTRPALFPLSYTSTTNSGGGGENCTPDDLLCRQTPCCLGYATSNCWSGVRELHPCFRTGDPGYCSYTNSAWSEQRESNSRHQLGRLRHQPLYHARNGGR